MKRSLLFIIICAIIVLGALGYRLKLQNLFIKERPEIKEEKIMAEKPLEGKKVALIIAFKDFRDVEYFIPRDVLQAAGVKIITVSTQKGTALGADGGEVEVDLTIDDLSVSDFDGLAFIGGPSALKYLDNDQSYEVARKAVEADKALGAICISPTILAKAGVLKGKKATVWSAPLRKEGIKALEENGAIYQDKDVVTDGKIVTANGPGAARKFGEALIEVLK